MFVITQDLLHWKDRSKFIFSPAGLRSDIFHLHSLTGIQSFVSSGLLRLSSNSEKLEAWQSQVWIPSEETAFGKGVSLLEVLWQARSKLEISGNLNFKTKSFFCHTKQAPSSRRQILKHLLCKTNILSQHAQFAGANRKLGASKIMKIFNKTLLKNSFGSQSSYKTINVVNRKQNDQEIAWIWVSWIKARNMKSIWVGTNYLSKMSKEENKITWIPVRLKLGKNINRWITCATSSNSFVSF